MKPDATQWIAERPALLRINFPRKGPVMFGKLLSLAGAAWTKSKSEGSFLLLLILTATAVKPAIFSASPAPVDRGYAIAGGVDKPRLIASATNDGILLSADDAAPFKSWSLASGKGSPSTFIYAACDGKSPPRIYSYTIGADASGDVTPAPTPAPVPTPLPPVVQKIAVTILEESHDRTPAQAAVIASPALRQYAAAGGHVFAAIDKDVKSPDGSTPAKFKEWIDYAASRGAALPHIFVTAKDSGQLLYDGPLPATEAEALSIAKKYGG